MNIRDRYRRLASYNRRANEEAYQALAGLTDRVRKRDLGAWFGSLHGILNHLIICDINWLRRYRALAPDSEVLTDPALSPPGLSWEHDLHQEFSPLRQARTTVDEVIIRWFESCPEDIYDRVFTYQDSRGTEYDALAADAFDFLFLHQTHHRGQISQILDRLGVPNNLADNNAFLAEGLSTL